VKAKMLERATRPLRQRLGGLVARGIVRLVNQTPGVQLLQVGLLAGETRDGVEHVQPYGYTSNPLPGAEPAVVLFPQGDRSHGIAIVVGDRLYRLRPLQSGEVAIYDDQGQKVYLKRNGIEIATTLNVTVQATGNVELNAGGNVNVIAAVDVNLGGLGGQPVARVGDRVNVGAGSSQGLWPIVEGSSKVSAT
jgi:phage baseplate assembly protein V